MAPVALAETHAIRLKYFSDGYFLQFQNPLDGTEVAFTKEPDYGGKAVRGVLPTGTKPEEYTGYAWVPSENRLYVDTNRNRDLTDDQSLPVSDGRMPYPRINNVHVQQPHPTGRAVYTLSVEFRRSEPWLTVSSGWSGEAVLNGSKWHVMVMDNLDGVIDWQDRFALRTQEEHKAYQFNGFTDPCATSAPKRLFLNGRAYEVTYAFDKGDLIMTLDEYEPVLGTMTLPGKSMARLVVEDPPQGLSVLLHRPAGTVSVPTGTYDVRQVFLDDGSASGPNNVVTGCAEPVLTKAVTISEGEPATLAAGAPLASKVTAVRHGVTVNLSHALVGLGGEEYKPKDPGLTNPPGFGVLKDGEFVEGGPFRYG
jgi:hypothetical protein